MSKTRVLVVEDQAVAAKITCRSLQKLGYEVAAVVASGEEAVHAAAETRPDVVLMDIQLEGEINGIEAAAQIRAQLDIPVVYLTAHADEAVLEQAKITAPFGYILKPFRERELHINIEIALSRHTQERKLRESERKYRELVQNANSIILRVTPQWDITFFNEFAQNFFGYTEDEILGQNAVGTIVPESESTGRDLVQLMDDIVNRPEQYRYNENENMRSTGEHVWVAWTNNAIVDEEGRVVEVLCIGTDITESKRAEEALRRRNRDLTTLHEAAMAISSDLSLDVVLHTVVEQMAHALDADECTLSLWNRAADLVETAVDYSAVRPDDVEPLGTTYNLDDYPATRQVLETGQPLVVQSDDPTADQSELALLKKWGLCTLLMLPMTTRDQVVGLVELTNAAETRDYTPEEMRLAESLAAQAAIAIENARLYEQAQQEIAERRRLQAHLQEYAQHLEELVDAKVRELERERAKAVHADKLAALGELATSVAHELNQPLTVMLLKSDYFKMAAQRMKAEVGEGSPNARFYDELYQVGEELAEDVGRCSRIISHLRSFGRISEGHATDVNLNDPIEDSFILVGQRLRHHDIEVHLQLAQDLPLILADPHRLEQVFLNLINNAEYALEEMARRVTSIPSTTYHKRLEIATFVEGDWVVATVNDNGCGIPTTAQEHIFESFFTTKPMGEGTGLGLSISHDILIEYGAEITFESVENEGTTFTLRFPVLDEDTNVS